MAVWCAGLVEDGVMLGERRVGDDLAALPASVQHLFTAHGRSLHRVAVTVGPGSFTGLRASIALAHGIALAADVPVVGVTVGAALAAEPGEPVWTAIDSKRGRIFLEHDGRIEVLALDALPIPSVPVALGGDAALAVGEVLASRGATIRLLDAAKPDPIGIARAAVSGHTLPALPVYVEPPAARPGPAGRPAPA